MLKATNGAQVVYHREVDGWWAESPDVKGWSAAVRTLFEIEDVAETGIAFAQGAPAECDPT